MYIYIYTQYVFPFFKYIADNKGALNEIIIILKNKNNL